MIKSQQKESRLIIKGGYKLYNFLVLLMTTFFCWIVFFTIPDISVLFAFLFIFTLIAINLIMLYYMPISFVITVDRYRQRIFIKRTFPFLREKEYSIQDLKAIEVVVDDGVSHLVLLTSTKKMKIFSLLDVDEIAELISKFINVKLIKLK